MRIMSVLFIAVLVLLPVSVFSRPSNFQYARINSITKDADPLDMINNGSDEVYPYLPDVQNAPELPSSYAPEWGTDRLVSDQWNMTNSVISMDYDADGYLYVMGISKNSGYDSLKLYKSTDQGYSWSLAWMYGVPAPWQIWDMEMRVNHVGSDPDIYYFFVDSLPGANERTMWFGKIDQPAMTPSWTEFDPDTSSYFVTPLEVSMDITDEATPDIWCSYSRETTDNYGWASLRSSDAGATWSLLGHASTRGGRDPYISFSTDYAYELAIYTRAADSNAIRLCRTQIGGSGSYVWATDLSLQTRSYPCLASTKETYPNNLVEVLYQQGSGSARRIMESFSSDGGQNWTLSQLWPMTGDVQSIRPYVRSGWWGGTDDEICGVATIPGTFDSLVVAYNTGSWGSRTVPNDYRSTGEVTPQATVIYSGRAVAYREWGTSNVWFESFANNAVEEIPSEVLLDWSITGQNNSIRIDFTLETPQSVTLKMYDVLGRNVLTEDFGTLSEGSHSYVFNTEDITSGRYFVSVRAGEKNLSKSVVLF